MVITKMSIATRTNSQSYYMRAFCVEHRTY